MTDNTTFSTIVSSVFIFSVAFKFIAMIVGVLGNVIIYSYNIHNLVVQRKDSDIILLDCKLGISRSSRVFNILSTVGHRVYSDYIKH